MPVLVKAPKPQHSLCRPQVRLELSVAMALYDANSVVWGEKVSNKLHPG